MNKFKLTGLAVCGGLMSMAGGALLGQQSSTIPGSSSSSPSSTIGQSSSSSQGLNSGSTSSSAAGGLGASSTEWGHSGSHARLSHLMNAPVQSSEGKNLGYIRDFTVDPNTGRIQFAILSLSPSGGASDTATSGRETTPSSRSSVTGTPSASDSSLTGKLIPVPWQLFSQSWQSSSSSSSTSSSTQSSTTSGMSHMHPLVLNLDESRLQSAPSFESSNWNELNQGTLDQRVYSFYGVDRMSGAGTSGSSISGQGGTHSYGGSSSSPHGSSSTSQGSSSSSQGSSSGADNSSTPKK